VLLFVWYHVVPSDVIGTVVRGAVVCVSVPVCTAVLAPVVEKAHMLPSVQSNDSKAAPESEMVKKFRGNSVLPCRRQDTKSPSNKDTQIKAHK
jgi:hypothetical protein